MITYNNQKAWKEIQSFLPKEYHFTKEHTPKEEILNWQGCKIHIDTFRNPNPKAKIIALHGVGTNGRQISMIMSPLVKKGYEIIAPDMPTYGISEVNPKSLITYDDWVLCASDLIEEESKKDSCPIFVYGLSAGGCKPSTAPFENKIIQLKELLV